MRSSSRERRSARPALRHAFWLFTLFLAAGQHVEAYTPTKGSIGGKVVDESNAPLPGVTVVLLSAGQGTRLDERKTDPSGSFLFAGLIPGAFQLAFLPPEGTDLVGDTFLNQTPPLPLKVEAGRVVRVARTLKKGGRLEISFLRESGPWVPTSCPCTFDLSSPVSAFFKEPDVVDGRLLYRGLPLRDDYRLTFEPEGHGSQVIDAISIRSGQTTHVSVRYDPEDSTGLAGMLRMADGTPIGDTLVTARSFDQAESALSAGSAKTDSAGKFKIVGLRPGIYTLTAGRQLGQVTVVQGTIVDVDLVFDSQVGSSGVRPRMLAFLDWLSPPAFLTLLAPAPTLLTQAPPPPQSPPTSWPWRSSAWIGVCDPPRLPRQVADTDSLYRQVVPEIVVGIEEGLECLRSRAPERARKLDEHVNPSGIIPFTVTAGQEACVLSSSIQNQREECARA